MLGKIRQLSGALRRVRGVSKQKATAGVALLCLLLVVSSRRPFSLLFPVLHDEAALKNVATHLNTQRTQAALDYLSLTPKKTQQELRAMAQPGNSSFRFTVALITMGRKKVPFTNRDVGYVLQSAASVIDLVKTKEAFRNSFVFVCNVDLHPASHADAAVLKDFLPYVERFGTSTVPNMSALSIPGTKQLYRDAVDFNMYFRELHDYMFCLQAAHQYRSEYYLILQDDAVPHPDFSEVLEHHLAKLTKPQTCQYRSLHRNSSLLNTPLLPSYRSCLSEHPPYSLHPVPPKERTISPSPNSSFGFLKFYFPERWQGFAFECDKLAELCSLGSVGGGLGLLLHALWSYRHGRAFQPGWRAFGFGVAVVLLIAYAVGRQNLNELRRVSKYLYRFQPSPRCCIPAMLYPAPVMPYLITWLADSPTGIYVDLRIADCFDHYQVPGYYIEPNIVHHVGMVTTLPKTNKKPVEEFLLLW